MRARIMTMSNTDLATKQDLNDLGISIRREMRNNIAALRVDMKSDMKEMFDDVFSVLNDMLSHIDTRFNKLEIAFDKQEEGY
jgi:hypothetical protein